MILKSFCSSHFTSPIKKVCHEESETNLLFCNLTASIYFFRKRAFIPLLTNLMYWWWGVVVDCGGELRWWNAGSAVANLLNLKRLPFPVAWFIGSFTRPFFCYCTDRWSVSQFFTIQIQLKCHLLLLSDCLGTDIKNRFCIRYGNARLHKSNKKRKNSSRTWQKRKITPNK